jgi:hypothetical protein
MESQLQRIEPSVCSDTGPRSVLVLRFVESIDGLASFESAVTPCSIGQGTLVCYFGWDPVVKVSKEIEVVGTRPFASCGWIQGFEFEDSSKWSSMGARAFEKCRMLSAICLPPSANSVCFYSELAEAVARSGSEWSRFDYDRVLRLGNHPFVELSLFLMSATERLALISHFTWEAITRRARESRRRSRRELRGMMG